MPTEFQQHCETIEESYEFTLSYAAQGHGPNDVGPQGQQLRNHLTRAVKAMRALEASSAVAVAGEHLQPAAPYETFLKVLARDAQDSIAAVELVLAQPGISSHLIDHLNAAIHLRALLTDGFPLVFVDRRLPGVAADAVKAAASEAARSSAGRRIC
jgi:hypothetical protein